jgi:hypothetical protein
VSGGSKWFFITERIDIRCVLPHVIIALAAFLVFAGTLTHGFVWDDEDVIYHARSIVEEEGPAGLLKAPFTADQDEGAGNSGYYRPVSLLSMWLNDPFSQPSPFIIFSMSSSTLSTASWFSSFFVMSSGKKPELFSAALSLRFTRSTPNRWHGSQGEPTCWPPF